MDLPQGQADRNPASAADGQTMSDLSLVEIAQRLERVTAAIETERTREREARAAYKLVAEEVEAQIARVRTGARALVEEQRRRMASFDGMIASGNRRGPTATDRNEAERGGQNGRGGSGGDAETLREVKPNGRSGRLSLPEAILRVWRLDKYDTPMTTEEIAAALSDVGYSSRASARSLKSTMNQALAKLCRQRKIRRYRIDGTEIDGADPNTRARRYMAC